MLNNLDTGLNIFGNCLGVCEGLFVSLTIDFFMVGSRKERLKFARYRKHLYFDKDIHKMVILGFTPAQLQWFKDLKR